MGFRVRGYILVIKVFGTVGEMGRGGRERVK